MAIDKLFGNLLGSASSQGAFGGAASGALVSLLMNKKSRKKLGKTAFKVGGVAAVAGLGYFAYKKWQESQSGQAAAAPSDPAATQTKPPSVEEAARAVPIDEALGVKLLLAMIAAAAADGKIDKIEMNALFESMEGAGLTPQENAKLTAALNQPPSAEEVASLAEGPEQASELYAASLSAIDLDTPAEDLYLRRLARSLSLDDSLVQQLHAAAGELAE